MASSLTTSAMVNTYLGSSSYSAAQIAAAVAAANDEIEKYCGRTFAATTRHEWTQALDGRVIFQHYPIIQIYRSCVGTRNMIRVTNSHPDVTQANIIVLPGTVSLAVTGAVEATAEIDCATTGYMGALAAAIAAAGYGWEAELLLDDHEYACSARPGGLVDAYMRPVYIEGPGEVLPLADIDVVAGCAKVSRCGEPIYLNYKAGYSTIPGDLSQIATEVAVAILQSAAVNRAVKSEHIGNYSYVTAGASEIIRIQFADRLSSYRRRLL